MKFKLWMRDPRNRRRFIFGAAAAAVVVLLFLRRKGAGTTAAAPVTTTSDVGPLFDPSSLTDGTPGGLDGGIGGGGDSGGVAPVSPDDLSNITDQLGNLQDQLNNLADNPDGTSAGDTPLTPSPTAPGTTPSAPSNGASTTPGFWWNVGGKQTFVTRKNVAAFLAELKRHGVSVASWAAAHAQAARSVGIPVPASPPPRAPGASSPARETGGAARAAPTSTVAKPTPAPPAAVGLLPTAPPAAASFAWGGRTWRHGDLNAFKAWLAAHGTNWATWSRQHTSAAAILT